MELAIERAGNAQVLGPGPGRKNPRLPLLLPALLLAISI